MGLWFLLQSVEQCPVLPEIVEETTTPLPETTTTEEPEEEEITTLAPTTTTSPPTTSSPSTISTHVLPTVACPTCDCLCDAPEIQQFEEDLDEQPTEIEGAFNLTSELVYTEVSENSVEELGPRDQEAYTQLRQPKVYASSKSEEVGVAALMSQEQVVMIAVATGVASLVIGFILGFFP